MLWKRSFALLFALVLASCHEGSKAVERENVLPAPSAIGSNTKVTNVRSIKGTELGHLARALGGNGTLINVWASWCGSCKGELPVLHDFAAEYQSKGLHVVVVSVDEPDQYLKLPDLVAGYGFSPPIWVAGRPLGEFKWALAQNWKGNIPVTFLYDSRGRRRFFWDGPVEAAEIRPVVDELVAGKDVQGEKHFPLADGITEESANVP